MTYKKTKCSKQKASGIWRCFLAHKHPDTMLCFASTDYPNSDISWFRRQDRTQA